MARKKQGRHPENALTAQGVKSLRTPGKYADGGGLYLVVSDTGSKKWVWRGVIDGRRRELGLGSATHVALSSARDEARSINEARAKRVDVIAERRKLRRSVPSFREAAKAVHETHLPNWKNPKHQAQWINTLDTYAFPVFGDMRVDAIDSSDVMRVLKPIWNTKAETAHRVKQRIKAVFDWAKASGHRSGDNPVEGIDKALPTRNREVKHQPALPYNEIKAFVEKLRSHSAHESTKLALEYLILTAARTKEVREAVWDEIDDNDAWIIPAARMKAKAEHRVPLPKRCAEILGLTIDLPRPKAKEEDAEKRSHSLIFPGTRPGRPLSENTFTSLVKDIGYANITVHGFRSTFRDWAAEQTSHPHDVVEMALAHKIKNKVEAAYKRTDLFDKRKTLMDDWAAFVTGVKPGPPARRGGATQRKRSKRVRPAPKSPHQG
jgi:integrase